MSRILTKFIGLVLIFLGIYFFGQNIIFVSGYYAFSYRSLPAMASVLAVMGGILLLIFFRRETGKLGIVLLGVGIVLVFLSGGVFLKPTSLWNFIVAFTALVAGYKLLDSGRINF